MAWLVGHRETERRGNRDATPIVTAPVVDSTDSVKKLRFQSYPKNFEAVESSLSLGRGGPYDLLLRATKRVLTIAPTIRRTHCQLQRARVRDRGHRNLEFFNRIDLTHERWTPYQTISSPRTVAGPGSQSMSAGAAGCKTLPCNRTSWPAHRRGSCSRSA